jgi:primosomal protein N' (replication factor Y)
LVGTQTLAKGLDLPNLTVVGVINADISLYNPDFTASERTYQLIRQVVGRIARGHKPGLAVIQTYMPDNGLLNLALSKNWPEFYETELSERQKFGFPPFNYLLKLTCRRKKPQSAAQSAAKLATKLSNENLKIKVSQPMPATREKSASGYEWQIIVSSRNRGELLKVVPGLPSGWNYDIDPGGVL